MKGLVLPWFLLSFRTGTQVQRPERRPSGRRGPSAPVASLGAQVPGPRDLLPPAGPGASPALLAAPAREVAPSHPRRCAPGKGRLI